MANPKRRHSNSRTGMGRAHHAIKPKQYGECPQCHQPKLPHRVCSNCGTYSGRQVVSVEG